MAAFAIQLGNCYRVEIDLTPLVDTSGRDEGTPNAAGARGGQGGRGPGGDAGTAPTAGAAGLGGARAGDAGAAGDGGVAGEAGAAGEGGVAGSGGSRGTGISEDGIPIKPVGDCEDETLSSAHALCHITGERPGAKECAEADSSEQSWQGCYDGGCSVCTLHGELPGFPYYFDWHPCCSRNDTCSNHDLFVCNALCPAPTEHDKVAPCGRLNPNPG